MHEIPGLAFVPLGPRVLLFPPMVDGMLLSVVLQELVDMHFDAHTPVITDLEARIVTIRDSL